mmetsp:Transcript_19225/g.46415  ORF Transcript_19225/g.46415 Transcript_19225/m.46415 type:complete len:232 (-) Transcript_19225:7-702(-)
MAGCAQERPREAVSQGRGVGRSGLPGRRRASGDLRRTHHPRPVGQRGKQRRSSHRHHPARGVPSGRAQGNELLRESRHSRARRGREHGGVRVSQLQPRLGDLPSGALCPRRPSGGEWGGGDGTRGGRAFPRARAHGCSAQQGVRGGSSRRPCVRLWAGAAGGGREDPRAAARALPRGRHALNGQTPEMVKRSQWSKAAKCQTGDDALALSSPTLWLARCSCGFRTRTSRIS